MGRNKTLREAANGYAFDLEEGDLNTNRDTFIAGAEWAIDKACECHGVLVGNLQLIVKEDAGGYPYIPIIELYDYEKDIPLAKVGDKVKVLIFKEE